jgi:hypothetical protein
VLRFDSNSPSAVVGTARLYKRSVSCSRVQSWAKNRGVKPLTNRELNRATLARQLLLKREKTTPLKVIERLVGLQAQLARPPFIGLWSRIQRFDRAQLIKSLHSREVVRSTSMRATIHLMSAKDYSTLRPAIQPVLDRAIKSILRDRTQGLDIEQLVAEARKFFDHQPATFDALRDHLQQLHPKADERAMGYSVRCLLPLVQVPTDAPWGFPGAAAFTVAESWLGRKLGTEVDPRALVLRYLEGFGPATPADAQSWSGLQGLAPTFEALRPKLTSFENEDGRELFDLPGSPRPDAAVPAPVRFLPDFDTLMLGHADRRRLIAEEHRSAVFTKNLLVPGMFLVDGFVAGIWKIERARKSATLVLKPFEKLSKSNRAQVEEEGQAMLRFAEPDAPAFAVR